MAKRRICSCRACLGSLVSFRRAALCYFRDSSDYVDAFFETVSGFTTTGSTILQEIESLPRGINFWRCFTH